MQVPPILDRLIDLPLSTLKLSQIRFSQECFDQLVDLVANHPNLHLFEFLVPDRALYQSTRLFDSVLENRAVRSFSYSFYEEISDLELSHLMQFIKETTLAMLRLDDLPLSIPQVSMLFNALAENKTLSDFRCYSIPTGKSAESEDSDSEQSIVEVEEIDVGEQLIIETKETQDSVTQDVVHFLRQNTTLRSFVLYYLKPSRPWFDEDLVLPVLESNPYISHFFVSASNVGFQSAFQGGGRMEYGKSDFEYYLHPNSLFSDAFTVLKYGRLLCGSKSSKGMRVPCEVFERIVSHASNPELFSDKNWRVLWRAASNRQTVGKIISSEPYEPFELRYVCKMALSR